MNPRYGSGQVRCKHGWVMATVPPHTPAALQAAQAPTADALGQAGQLGIRNSLHVLCEALPLLSAFQLRLRVKDGSVLSSWVTFSSRLLIHHPLGLRQSEESESRRMEDSRFWSLTREG